MSFISRSPSFITEINVLSISSVDLVIVLNIISSRLLIGIVSRERDVRDVPGGVVLLPHLQEVVSKDIPQIGHVGVGSSTAVGSDSDSDCGFGSGSDCCSNPEQHLRVVYHAAVAGALDCQRPETKKVVVEVGILVVAGYDYIVVVAVGVIAVVDVLVADVLVVDVLVVHRKRSLTTLSTTE